YILGTWCFLPSSQEKKATRGNKETTMKMTDLEFDILDLIYFVESFEKIQNELTLEEDTLKAALKAMIEKGWVKCFENHFSDVTFNSSNFEHQYKNYHYLATKEGLIAHNTL
ncbi:MAG: hypothetical protein SFU27_05235, partial [Thermonemataceae bacterium]|nr:hypothetical protein [Thermonemataceae bacterium]